VYEGSALRTFAPLFIPLLCALVLAVGAPRAAHAQPPANGFSLDRFRPAPTTEDGLALVMPRTLGHLRPGATLTLDYAHQPLVLSKTNADASGAIVKHALVGHVMGAIGLFDNFEAFVHVPITFVQSGNDPKVAGVGFPSPQSASFGSITLGGTARVLGDDLDALQLGLLAAVTLPSGSKSGLSGDDGVPVEARLTGAYHMEKWSLAANAGGRYRPNADYGNARIGSELLFGAGAYYRMTEHWMGIGELNGATTFRDSQAFKSQGTPLEFMLAARWTTPVLLVLTGGLSVGLTQAIGVPDVRAILQAGWPPPRPPLAPPDRDHDGILDDKDRCPDVPEDKDQFQDEDGCPDPDNDHDGILDEQDECVLDPEDHDGFEDENGCPDADNDADGLLDAQDKCPNAPEDKDGFQDADGCPDLDNDQDGVPDVRDKCPLEPEDPDGFADDDGCPDPDNDNDGVLDADDACPTVPGPAHAKGCPSAVRIDRSQIRILERIEFATNRAEIRPESLGIIDQVRGALEANPQIKKIRIEGHTDHRGSNEKNLKLSQHRAEAVMKYLILEGIAPERLEAKGWGEEKPLAGNDSDEGMQTNRRVEFHIVDPAPPEEDSAGKSEEDLP
jgi:outer membrane protein OmpA-like peptidoglycan-associated protein